MPKKIHMEKTGYGLRVFSDLSLYEIQNIDGVVSVDDVFLDEEGFLLVYIDKRYDREKVMRKLVELANENQN